MTLETNKTINITEPNLYQNSTNSNSVTSNTANFMTTSDVPVHEQTIHEQTGREQTLHPVKRPAKRTDTAKAWIMTLVLHFLIAGGLASYWYFYQRPQATTPLTAALPSNNAQPVAIDPTPASSLTTLSTVVTVSSSVASTATSSTVSQTAMPNSTLPVSTPTATAATTSQSPTGKPLADYLAHQQAQQPAQPTNLPSNGITPVPIPTATTTYQQKVITHDAPVKKALTDRDIAKNERSNSNEVKDNATQASPKTDSNLTKTVSKPTDIPANSSPEKEAYALSKDIDDDNDKISQLIEQVKTKNQQQIDAQFKQDKQAKPATTTPNTTETAQKPASAP